MADTAAPPTLQELVDSFKRATAAIPVEHTARLDQHGALIARMLTEQGVDVDDPEQARVLMIATLLIGNVVAVALDDYDNPFVAVDMCGTVISSLANMIAVRHGRESVGEDSDAG